MTDNNNQEEQEQIDWKDGESSLLPNTGSNNNLPSTVFEAAPSVTRAALEQLMSPEHNTSIKKAPSPAERDLFVVQCLTKGINPLAGDVDFWTDDEGNLTFVIKESFYLRVADNHPNFRAIQSGVIVERGPDRDPFEIEGGYSKEGEKIVGGWALVHRSDRDYPIVHKVNFRDYDKKYGAWTQFPGRMIEKVAQVGALRQAFPSQFGGLYSSDEMPDEGSSSTNNAQNTTQKVSKGHAVQQAQDRGAVVEGAVVEHEEQNEQPMEQGQLESSKEEEQDPRVHSQFPDKLFIPSARCSKHKNEWRQNPGRNGGPPWHSCGVVLDTKPDGNRIYCQTWNTDNNGKEVQIVEAGSS